MNRTVRLLLLVGLVAGLLALGDAPTSQAQSGLMVQVMCNQYIRTERSDESPRVGLMNPGETHLAIGRYGDWLLIQINPQLVGWAYDGECLDLQGSREALPLIETYQTVVDTTGPPLLDVLCTQYVRTQPHPDATSVALMYASDPPWTILERNTDGDWLLVINADGGLAGWTSFGECVAVRGDFNSIPVSSGEAMVSSGPPVATLICSQYLRAYPSLEGRHLAIMDATFGPLQVIGRDEDAAWLYVQLSDGSLGWTSNSECLTVRGNVVSAPVMPPPSPPVPIVDTAPAGTESTTVATIGGPPALSVLCTQYVRTQPDAEALNIAIMYPDDPGWSILGRNTDTSWLLVTNHNGGFFGWTAAGTECLYVTGDLAEAPIVDSTSGVTYDGPPIAQLICAQHLRSTPDTESRSLGVMTTGEGPYSLIGRNADNTWLLMIRGDGTQGWTANSECLGIQGNTLSLPIVSTDLAFDSPPSVALTCTQYLRTQPDENASVITILDGSQGALSLIGRTTDSDWLLITLQNGTNGWAANGACVVAQGNVSDLPVIGFGQAGYDGPPLATVSCTQYLRSGPDEESASVWILDGTEGMLVITGRTDDLNWMQVMLSNGVGGWAATGVCLDIQGDFYDVPVVTFGTVTYTGPAVASVTCTQYLRTIPDEEGDRITVMQPGEGLSVIGRTEAADWLYVQRFDGLQGWTAYGECVNTQGDVLAVPIQPVIGYTGPPVADIICDTNLRRNPMNDGEILRVLGPDTGFLNIIGHDDDSEWLLVEHPNALVGWVSYGSCVATQGNILTVPAPNSIVRDPALWTIIRAAGGECDGSDQASQLIRAYNHTGPIGAVARYCAFSDEALGGLARFDVEVAIVDEGGCPGFQQVALSGGQTLCHRAMRTSQIDDFMNYARGQ